MTVKDARLRASARAGAAAASLDRPQPGVRRRNAIDAPSINTLKKLDESAVT
jgi:hypothetical protein